MAMLNDGNYNRPMSGAGVGTIDEEEEEQVWHQADSTPGPSSSAGPRVDEAAEPSPSISSASDTAPPPTARDLKRVQRRLVRATEHLRESLADTTGQLWEKVDLSLIHI